MMNGKIYKVIPSISKEDILNNCEFDTVPDYGDVCTYRQFIDMVEDYAITDYDGTGRLMLYGKIVKHSSTWLHNRTVYFADRFFVPFYVLHSIFGEDMKFIWFNK